MVSSYDIMELATKGKHKKLNSMKGENK